MANSVAPLNSTTSEDARSLCQAATRMPVAEEHRRAVCGTLRGRMHGSKRGGRGGTLGVTGIKSRHAGSVANLSSTLPLR